MPSPLRRNISTETDVYYKDDTGSMDLPDITEKCRKKTEGYRSIFVVSGNLSKIAWTAPLKKIIQKQ